MRVRKAARAFAWIGLSVSALSALGCVKQQPGGEVIGRYAVKGQLVSNTCGAALPAKNLLSYVAELRQNAGVTSWKAGKLAAASGALGSAGNFNFQVEQSTDLGTTVQAKQDLQPSDFLSGQANPDLKQTHCILLTIETLAGTLHRRWTTAADGGMVAETTDAGSDAGVGGADLTGTDTISVMPATGADCSAALAVQGGTYTILPCSLQYALEGTLEAN